MVQCDFRWRSPNNLLQNLNCSAFKLSFAALAFLDFLGTSAYGRSLDGGGWISLFGLLPPAEIESFRLMTGVDVEGRRGARCLAGAVVVGVGTGGAGAGGGAFLAGGGLASSGGGRFLIDLSNNSSTRLPICEIACSGPLNFTQFVKTSRTSAMNWSAVWYRGFSGLGSGLAGFEKLSFRSIVEKSMGWVTISG